MLNLVRRPRLSAPTLPYYRNAAVCALIACLVLLSGCNNALIKPTPPYKPLPSKELGNILAAEMALHRGYNQQASELYLHSAERLNNADMAKRATYAAQLSNRLDTYKQGSQLWHHLQPDAILAQQHLAQSLYHNGDIDLAIDTLTSLIAQHPDYLPAVSLLTEIYLEQQRYADSHNLLLPYTRISHPDRLMGSLHIRTLSRQQNYPQALQLNLRLTKLYPDDVSLRLTAALLSEQLQQPAQAREHLLHAYAIEPNNPQVNFYLAENHLAAGENTLAIKHYQLTGGGPNLLKAINKGIELAPPKDTQRADYFQQLRQQHPHISAQLFLLEADFLKHNKQLETAYQVYAHAVAKHPANTDILYAQAMLGAYLRDWPTMEQALLTIIKLDPEHAHALNALGYTYADHNTQLNQAKEYISLALSLRPNDPAILDSMGWVNYRLGHYRTARDYLKQAFSLLPDAEIAAHLGVVEWALGDIKAAQQVWNSILQQDPDNQLIRQAILDAQEEFPSDN